MDYATWEKHKKELANEGWTAWAKWPADVRDAMRELDSSNIEVVTHDGHWIPAPPLNGFRPGGAYRVSPSWQGPSKPEPAAEYEHCTVVLAGEGTIYTYTYQGKTSTHTRSIDSAVAHSRFAGYVQLDGKIRPRLIFDPQKDGTYRLRVPKAVRLRKEGGL
jgi:hypothetical protein